MLIVLFMLLFGSAGEDAPLMFGQAWREDGAEAIEEVVDDPVRREAALAAFDTIQRELVDRQNRFDRELAGWRDSLLDPRTDRAAMERALRTAAAEDRVSFERIIGWRSVLLEQITAEEWRGITDRVAEDGPGGSGTPEAR